MGKIVLEPWVFPGGPGPGKSFTLAISPNERLRNSIRTMNVRIRNCMDDRERRALTAVRDAMRDTLAQ